MLKLISSLTAQFVLVAGFGLAPNLTQAFECRDVATSLLSVMRRSAECLAQEDWYKPVSENCKSTNADYDRRANTSNLTSRTAASMRTILVSKAKLGGRLPEVACYPEMALKNTDDVWDFDQVIAFEQIPAIFFLTTKNAWPGKNFPSDLVRYEIQNANPNRFAEGTEISLSGSLEPLEPGPARCEFRQKALVRITIKASGRTFTEPLICESML